jgi:hypothetical protein
MASSAADTRRARRRAKVWRLADDGLSQRAVARELGLDRGTVASDLAARADEPAGGPPAPPAGNQRAVTHGATSEVRLKPLREKHAVELRRDYPWVDDRRLAVLADAAARFESAATFLDATGRVVKDASLNVWPVSDRMDRWGVRLWQMLSDLEAEGKANRKAMERLGDAEAGSDMLASNPELADAAHEFLHRVAERRSRTTQ